MQELINFTEWFHSRYIPWGERGDKLFLPLDSPEGIAVTSEEVVQEYYGQLNN